LHKYKTTNLRNKNVINKVLKKRKNINIIIMKKMPKKEVKSTNET